MARLNAMEMIAKYKRRAAAASGDFKEGVLRTRENPMELAAAAGEAWRQGLQEAMADGRWERGLRDVSHEDWKRATSEKGSINFATGVSNLSPKAERGMTENLANIEAVEAEIAPMPKRSFPERVERSVAWQTKMHERKRRG